jgi:hypothetical protein
MSVTFNKTGVQNINFGSPAGVVGLAVKTIAFWHYAADVSAASECTLLKIFDGTGTDTDEYNVIFRPDTQEQKIRFDVHFSTTDGSWYTTSNVLTATGWYHIAITYDGSATANNPKIFINGTSVAVTRNVAPVGTYRSGTSTTLYLSTDVSGFSPNGKMADARIYNVVLADADVLALYNALAFSPSYDTNLVFNAPLSIASQLGGADFNGFVLTSTQKLIDRIHCAQGTPTGSPVGSSTNP